MDTIEAIDAAVLRRSKPEGPVRGAGGDRAGLRMLPMRPSNAPNPFEAFRARFSPRGGGGDRAPSLDGSAGGGMLSLADGVIGSGTGDAGRRSSFIDSAELKGSSGAGAGLVGEFTTSLSFPLCSDSLRSAGAASLSSGIALGVGVGIGEVVSAFVGVSAGASASAPSVVASVEVSLAGIVVVVVVSSAASSNCAHQLSITPLSQDIRALLPCTYRLLIVTVVLLLYSLHFLHLIVAFGHGDAYGNRTALVERLTRGCFGGRLCAGRSQTTSPIGNPRSLISNTLWWFGGGDREEIGCNGVVLLREISRRIGIRGHRHCCSDTKEYVVYTNTRTMTRLSREKDDYDYGKEEDGEILSPS